VTVSGGELDKIGMLADFTILKQYLKDVLSKFDHEYLNEVKPFDKINPTAENIAKYIYGSLKSKTEKYKIKITKVAVWETDRNCAAYYE